MNIKISKKKENKKEWILAYNSIGYDSWPFLIRFPIRSNKEINDLDIIDAGVKCISDFGNDDLMPHFIYCGIHYHLGKERIEKLEEMILTKMRKYEIRSSILTMRELDMEN